LSLPVLVYFRSLGSFFWSTHIALTIGYGLFGSAATATGSTASAGCLIGREELVHWELHMAENLARILLTVRRVAGAFLFWQAIVVHRNEKLGIPLQPNEGKLAQRDIHPPSLAPEAQLAAEASTDARRHISQFTFAGLALAGINQLKPQNQRINRLHDGHWLIGLRQTALIQTVQNHVGGEGLGTTFATKQDYPLVENGQTTDLYRASSTHERVGGHPIEVAYIHCVKSPVEPNRLHTCGYVQ